MPTGGLRRLPPFDLVGKSGRNSGKFRRISDSGPFFDPFFPIPIPVPVPIGIVVPAKFYPIGTMFPPRFFRIFHRKTPPAISAGVVMALTKRTSSGMMAEISHVARRCPFGAKKSQSQCHAAATTQLHPTIITFMLPSSDSLLGITITLHYPIMVDSDDGSEYDGEHLQPNSQESTESLQPIVLSTIWDCPGITIDEMFDDNGMMIKGWHCEGSVSPFFKGGGHCCLQGS